MLYTLLHVSDGLIDCIYIITSVLAILTLCTTFLPFGLFISTFTDSYSILVDGYRLLLMC